MVGSGVNKASAWGRSIALILGRSLTYFVGMHLHTHTHTPRLSPYTTHHIRTQTFPYPLAHTHFQHAGTYSIYVDTCLYVDASTQTHVPVFTCTLMFTHKHMFISCACIHIFTWAHTFTVSHLCTCIYEYVFCTLTGATTAKSHTQKQADMGDFLRSDISILSSQQKLAALQFLSECKQHSVSVCGGGGGVWCMA